MQRVIVFSKRSFWSGQPDLGKLNEQIAQLNLEGWRVTHIAPVSGISGRISSWTLLVEDEPQRGDSAGKVRAHDHGQPFG